MPQRRRSPPASFSSSPSSARFLNVRSISSNTFLLVRRQALKDAEPFWSPPTRRVAQALVPALFAGFISALLVLVCPTWDFLQPWALPAFWILLYGCALCAAGFFMQRGIKLLGWLFLLCGSALMATRCHTDTQLSLLQLAYGVYLYFTEPRGNET